MARILVVDDDESARLFLASVLATAGHEPIVASSGEEALGVFLRDKPDVVVTDVHMPFGDGLELIGAIAGLDSGVPVIAVSGSGGPSILGTARTAGATISLPKPVDPARLVAAVHEAVGRTD